VALQFHADLYFAMLTRTCAGSVDSFLLPDNHSLVLSELSKLSSHKAEHCIIEHSDKSSRRVRSSANHKWPLDLVEASARASVLASAPLGNSLWDSAASFEFPWHSVLSEREQAHLNWAESVPKLCAARADGRQVFVDLSQSVERLPTSIGQAPTPRYSSFTVHLQLFHSSCTA